MRCSTQRVLSWGSTVSHWTVPACKRRASGPSHGSEAPSATGGIWLPVGGWGQGRAVDGAQGRRPVRGTVSVAHWQWQWAFSHRHSALIFVLPKLPEYEAAGLPAGEEDYLNF